MCLTNKAAQVLVGYISCCRIYGKVAEDTYGEWQNDQCHDLTDPQPQALCDFSGVTRGYAGVRTAPGGTLVGPANSGSRVIFCKRGIIFVNLTIFLK